MLDNVRADLAHARVINGLPAGWLSLWVKTPLHPGVIAVLTYRFSSWARRVRIPFVRQILLILSLVQRRTVEVVTGVEISPRAEIGPGLVVHTTNGVRSVGDNVYFGPGAKVIGRAAVGNNVRVVANSVVMTDVPDNLTVVGVPARIRWRNRASLTSAATLAVSLLPGVRNGDASEFISMLPLL
jgi:serine O-acetyltransferase